MTNQNQYQQAPAPNQAFPPQAPSSSPLKWVFIGVGIAFGGGFVLVGGLVLLALIGTVGASSQASFNEVTERLEQEKAAEVEATPVGHSVTTPVEATQPQAETTEEGYDPFAL